MPINNYKNLISQNEYVIEKLQEKIDFLYEVESSTMFLFKSACSFAKRARAAIDDGAAVNEISKVINSKDIKSFGSRATYYNNIVNNIAFDNLGMEEK